MSAPCAGQHGCDHGLGVCGASVTEPTRTCALTRSVAGTDGSVVCESQFRHEGPHTGVYASERYSWPHDPRCIRLVGAPENREFCDCRTLQMIDDHAPDDPDAKGSS